MARSTTSEEGRRPEKMTRWFARKPAEFCGSAERTVRPKSLISSSLLEKMIDENGVLTQQQENQLAADYGEIYE